MISMGRRETGSSTGLMKDKMMRFDEPIPELHEEAASLPGGVVIIMSEAENTQARRPNGTNGESAEKLCGDDAMPMVKRCG